MSEPRRGAADGQLYRGLSAARGILHDLAALRDQRHARRIADDPDLRDGVAVQRQQIRRLHILLERAGWEVNWKKLYRIYREERLTMRERGGRKRALGTRAPMAIPQGPNQRWSLDFVSDGLAWGRRFRVLCIIDDFSRECLCPAPLGGPDQI